MKRSLCLLVCFVLVAAMLTSCDVISSIFGRGDETTFADVWSSDATGHWHAAVSGNMEEVADFAAHADGNNDGKCDVCEYVMEEKEDTPPACTTHVDADKNGKCDKCGATVKVEEEEDEPCTEHVDADNNGKCDSCGADVQPAAPAVPALVIGANNVNVTAADIEAGAVNYTLTVETAGTYTFVTDNFAARVFDAENTLLGTGIVALEPGEYSVALVTFNVPEAGTYVVNLNFTASEGEGEGGGDVNVGTTLAVGPNIVVLTDAEIEADTATRPLTIAEAGTYQFNSSVFVSGITDSEGNDIERNSDYTFTLAEGDYTVTFSLFATFEIAAGTENELNIVAAGEPEVEPIYLYNGANTIPVTDDDIAAGFVSTIYYSYADGNFKFYSDIFAVTVKTEDGEVLTPVDGYVTLASWTAYTVELSTSLITEAGDYVVNVEYDAPEGSQENPIVLEELGSYVAEGVESYGAMWYSYVPSEDGTLNVTINNDNEAYIGAVTAVFGFESVGSLQVIAGRTYYIQIYNETLEAADINFTVAFTAGEIVRDGSMNIPYELPMGDVSVSLEWGNVYYMFVADEAGTLTITTTDTNYAWQFPTWNTDSIYDATLTIDVVAGDIVYLSVGTENWQADTIDFNVSFEGEAVITGTTYLGYDLWGNQTLTVLVGENVKYVVFTYNHPKWGPSSATYAYDVVNGAMVLYDEEGNTLNPMAGYVTLTDGVPTGAGYNGTNYSFTAPNVLGTEGNPYPLEADNTCEFNGGNSLVFYTYTAEAAGTLTVNVTCYDYFFAVVSNGMIDPLDSTVTTYTFNLAAGETIVIGVATASYSAGNVTFTSSFEASSTGEGEEGGDVAASIVSGTYEGAHSSGRNYRLVVDAEAGTMVVIKSNLNTGSLDTDAIQHDYTYTYVDGVFTPTQTSGTTTSLILTVAANGVPTMMTFGTNEDILLTAVEA